MQWPAQPGLGVVDITYGSSERGPSGRAGTIQRGTLRYLQQRPQLLLAVRQCPKARAPQAWVHFVHFGTLGPVPVSLATDND